MAVLKPRGIEKGKEFKPDARQRAVLKGLRSARICPYYARASSACSWQQVPQRDRLRMRREASVSVAAARGPQQGHFVAGHCDNAATANHGDQAGGIEAGIGLHPIDAPD